tara:strand:- start:836 stop:1411 length:576 start_codon:yes stop_codon:yes gene_type:complete
MCECSICLLPIEGEGIDTTCGHKFHLNCLNHWVNQCPNRSCPICRQIQPNENGELITYWNNASRNIKSYKYGNIEKKWYSNGYIKYDIVLKIDDDNTIIRSSIYSEDGVDKYIHSDFTLADIQRLRTSDDFIVPNRIPQINFIYNDNILFDDNVLFNDIIDIVNDMANIQPAVPLQAQLIEGIPINSSNVD